MTVACEPTGHRWRVLGQLAADRRMPFVCVQPMLTSWARRSEDLTFDKTDEKDAVLIARLTAQLRCYVPEPVDETWGRLRHLGARREQLIVEIGQPGAADAGAAGVCLAGGVGDRAATVPLADLDRGAERGRSTATAGTWPAPDASVRPGSSMRCDARSSARGRQKPCLRIVTRPVRGAGRPGRGDRPPPPARWNGSQLLLERLARRPTAGWPTPRPG